MSQWRKGKRQSRRSDDSRLPQTRQWTWKPRLERFEERVNPGFLAPMNFHTEASPTSEAVGDFNGDGLLDLVVANYSGNVSALLGNGDGSFQPAYTFPVGIRPSAIAVADVNGDGIPANSRSSDVSVLLGNGDGSFQRRPKLPSGTSPSSVAVRDFNGDGFPDLAVANDVSNVSVLLNDGIWTDPYPGAGVGVPAASRFPSHGASLPPRLALRAATMGARLAAAASLDLQPPAPDAPAVDLAPTIPP